MVWTCAEDEQRICWIKNLEAEAPRHEEGKPQRRFMDVVKEDMQRIGVTAEEQDEMK